MDYSEEFLASFKMKGLAKSTIECKEFYLKYFLNYLHDNGKEIKEINFDFIREFLRYTYTRISEFTGNKISAGTIFLQVNVIRQYFKYLTDTGILFINPSANLKLPKRRYSLPKTILSEEEIKKLVEYPIVSTFKGLRDRAMLELLYSAGLRGSELAKLNIFDVDLKNSMVRVNETKNKHDRVVPLGKTACFYVAKYLREGRGKYHTPKKKYDGTEPIDTNALFLNSTLGRFRLRSIEDMVKEYARELFPGKKITCHSLRHAFATHLLRGGANIIEVQQMLGHNSIDSTQIYTRISPTDLKEAHKKYHPRRKI